MRLPIKFLDDTKQVTRDHVKGAPCVELAVIFSTTPEIGSSHKTVIEMAMVDTGADLIYASPDLIEEISAPQIGQVGTVNGGAGASLHGIYLSPPRSNLLIPLIAIKRDWQETGGGPTRLVIGRAALQHFRMQLQFGDDDQSYLEYLEDNSAVIDMAEYIRGGN